MRINYDCVRCVMLYLEKNLSYARPIFDEDLVNVPILTSFEPDDVRYAVKQLYKEGMLECTVKRYLRVGDAFTIRSIEPEGHKFCEMIRNENNWEQAKPKFPKLETIKSVMETLASAATTVATVAGMLPK